MNEEEKKQREDMLRIKKIKQGQEEAIEEHYEEPKQNSKSKFVNFWLYNWLKIVIILIAATLITIFVKDIFFKEKVDLNITIAFSKPFTVEQMNLLEKDLEKYAIDLDKNGKTVVKFNYLDFSIPGAIEGTNQAGQQVGITLQTRLLGEIAANDTFVFIFDKGVCAKYNLDEQGFTDLSLLNFKDESKAVGSRLMLKNTTLCSDMNFDDVPDELSLSLRVKDGIRDIKNEKVKARYDTCVDFVTRILADEK